MSLMIGMESGEGHGGCQRDGSTKLVLHTIFYQLAAIIRSSNGAWHETAALHRSTTTELPGTLPSAEFCCTFSIYQLPLPLWIKLYPAPG